MTNLSDPIFTDENAAREHLERLRWPDGPVCPFCAKAETITLLGGKMVGDGWYHCAACRRKFTVRVGTVYERSHIPLHKWVLATHLMCSSKKGISAHQLHRMLGITYKSAWFLAHRIREAMRDDNPLPIGGGGKTVEVDETYIGRRKGIATPRGGTEHKMKIIGLVERGASVRTIKVEEVNARTVREIVVRNVSRESELQTDEGQHYVKLGWEFPRHGTVRHRIKEYAVGKDYTNTIEGYFGIFKRGMKGVYQHCGEQHLHRYLAEFDFRYNNRTALEIDDDERAARAIRNAEGKRLTYRRTDIRPNF